MEPLVERDYLNYLSQQCGHLIKYKNELEYKLSYYRHSQYRTIIENELRGLDFAPCERYYKFRDVNLFLLILREFNRRINNFIFNIKYIKIKLSNFRYQIKYIY